MKKRLTCFCLLFFLALTSSCQENESAHSKAEILDYTIDEQIRPAVINPFVYTVYVDVFYGTDITHLAPKITVSDGASISPSSGESVDFTDGPVEYTVISEDETSDTWHVKVHQGPPSSSEILSFSLDEQVGSAIIGENIIEIEVPNGTDLSSLTPAITVSDGDTISPASLEPVDFSSGSVNYYVTDENSVTDLWRVIVRYELYEADNVNYQYTGRIDFTYPKQPKFWSSGVYIETKFTGTICDVEIADERLMGWLNYIDVVVDGVAERIKITDYENVIRVAEGLEDTEHSLLISKDTEAFVGYLEFIGIRAKSIASPDPKPSRKIEFIGDSITCGAGMDASETSCDEGYYFDKYRSYLSYGPVTARALNAQWHITSESGIGLMHSCCNKTTVMPQVWDKLNVNDINSATWDHELYLPDVVTILLGYNDGIQDATLFCNAYISFIRDIRDHYPDSQIVCLMMPSDDAMLNDTLEKNIDTVVKQINDNGDKKVSSYFFTQSYVNGCGLHPDIDEHQAIADELVEYLEIKMHWR